MKTAISLPDDLFIKADRLAERMGKSRSQLYVEALQTYVSIHDEEALIAQINAVCDEVDTSLDPVLRKAQAKILQQEEW